MELSKKYWDFQTIIKSILEKIIMLPLPGKMIKVISGYYRDYMVNWHYKYYLDIFDFINEKNLRERLAQEFYVARYSAGIQNGMAFDDGSFELLGHLKFQIIQYAGIYEAVISYLLLNNFNSHRKVVEIQKKVEYKLVQDLPVDAHLDSNPGQRLAICRRVNNSIDWIRISFEDKLNAAIEIGFVKENLKKVILDTYLMRHSVHVERAVKDEILFEKRHVEIAYETTNTFLSDIKSFLLLTP